MQPTSRDVALDDVFNLRDLGGYATADGRRTRWRRLYRGAGLHRLAGNDIEIVRELGLATAIDLRTQGELDAVGRYPREELPADFHHLPMITSLWGLDGIDPDAPAADYLLARYREMLDAGTATIATTFRLLARDDAYPAVFYCAAGKDRTGVMAALLLSAVGVREEEIVADYALSHERVQRIVARAAARGDADAHSAMVAQPPAMMAAPAAAMELLLATIRDEHGSAHDYLEAIGVEREAVAAIEASLLEPAR
ncbi:MAG TPA: tyrosine-protein phosphatase [Conexibacter sp.]